MAKKIFRNRCLVPTKLNRGSVRLGAIVFLSALGLALFAIVMRAALIAAPVDVAPTWGKVLIAGGFGDVPSGQIQVIDEGHIAPVNDAPFALDNTFVLTATIVVVDTRGGSRLPTELNVDYYVIEIGNQTEIKVVPTSLVIQPGDPLAVSYSYQVPSPYVLSSTELYEPATNSFAAAADTAAMNTARWAATATLLPSGKVLIAGGANIFGGAVTSTELYDPATNSFAAPADTATMNAGRYDATATLLLSGKALIAGGYNSTAWLTSTELYDPATNSFAAPADTATMNVARQWPTATLLPSGKVLIAGGCCDNSGNYLASTELYDPATNSFVAPADTATMNVARVHATATLLPSGKVLIAGGYDFQSETGTASTELYDPATNSFAAAADTPTMNVVRGYATATLLPSGKVLIAGGYRGGRLSSTELYDPATNSFAAPADTAIMNAGRYQATATLLPSGKVLIAGGYGDDFFNNPLSSTELYDPATNSFAAATDTPTMNDARVFAVAALLPETPPPPSGVTLLPSMLDFGAAKVWQSSVARTFTLTNGSGQKLTISGWSIGPDFKIVSTTCPLPPPAPAVLPAGHSCNFQVSFRPQSVGSKNELLSVFDNARNSPQKVKLHGVATRR